VILAILALTVVLPATTPESVIREVKRLQPGVHFTTVVPVHPELDAIWPTAYVQYQDRDYAHPTRLGNTMLATRRISIYSDVVRMLVHGRGAHKFRIAMARVIAHEVEHVLYGPVHASSGWFASEIGFYELTGPAEPIRRSLQRVD